MDGNEDLTALLAFKGQYHNHKETMAHAAVAVQIAILVAIVSIDSLPISCFGLNKYWVYMQELFNSLAYFLIWIVIFRYMCWQLKMRNIARKQVNKIIMSLENHYSAIKKRALIHYMRDVGEKKGWFQKHKGEIILCTADIIVGIIGVIRIWSI